ncbi:MAG: hypothetical protein ACYDD0_11440 [Candidatus Dormibacteria bacterium]
MPDGCRIAAFELSFDSHRGQVATVMVWVWGAVVAADAGLRTRCGWGILAPLCLAALVGCGSPGSVLIPKASPTPKPATTALAPGVRVADSELQLPAYTVSVSHPLPSGVSAALVVKDVQIDNLLENIAIERQDPALLQYADSGDWLLAEKGEIASNQRQGLVVRSVRDTIDSIQAGFQVDPNNPRASAAVIVAGTEIEVELLADGKIHTRSTHFDVLEWLVWSAPNKRYLTCDTASG